VIMISLQGIAWYFKRLRFSKRSEESVPIAQKIFPQVGATVAMFFEPVLLTKVTRSQAPPGVSFYKITSLALLSGSQLR
jgi:hypothetical protein